MRRDLLVLVALGALGGCKVVSSSGLDAAPSDVASDAAPRDAAIDPSRMPFTTVGTTPAGSLDEVRFIAISFFAGFCAPGYRIDLHRTNELFDQALVHFYIPIADTVTEPPTGTILATAWPNDTFELRTEAVSFEIVQLDVPPTSPLRIAGRMTISMGAWNIDFAVDALTVGNGCL